MPVTIKVNGTDNSLVHKGSNHIARNTPPDVCKTPSPGGPVPIPYPVIISMSSDLAKGTTTVKVDGGNMAAIKGSEFSRCSGDEAGTAGGVVSSTNMKEATWITYSMNVKMNGKNACRLTDKMKMNHGNTVCMMGVKGVPVKPGTSDVDCPKVKQNIQNQKTEIADREREMKEDKLKLPWRKPGGLPRESKEGHLILIEEHKAHLRKWKGIYMAYCAQPGDTWDNI